MRKWIIRLAVLVVLVAGGLILKATVFAPKAIPVRFEVVERGVVEKSVTNSKAGTVKARQRSLLSPEIGGRVVEILKREGCEVKKGETLLKLDDSSLQAQLDHARLTLKAAEVKEKQTSLTAERAFRELERNQKLADERVISVDSIDAFQNRYDIAVAARTANAAEVETAKAAVRIASTELRKMTLTAPFDGIVADVRAEVGEWISPSPPMIAAPSVLDLINPRSIYVSAPMDEVDSAVIHEGQVARVTVDPYPDRSFMGKVVRIAPFVLDIEEQNRTVEIEVELDDAKFASRLLPGTSADVEVLLEVRENVLRIPTAAVMRDDQALVIEGDRLALRKLAIGIKNWAFTEVLDGLEEGERVITSLDRAEVKEGARVNPDEESSIR